MKRLLLIMSVLIFTGCSIFDETKGVSYFLDFSKSLGKSLNELKDGVTVSEDSEALGFPAGSQVIVFSPTSDNPVAGFKASYSGIIYLCYLESGDKSFAVLKCEDLDVNIDSEMSGIVVDKAEVYAVIDRKTGFVLDGFFDCVSGDTGSIADVRYSKANLEGCIFIVPELSE